MNELSEICKQITAVKAREDAAKAERHGLEARLMSIAAIAAKEGTQTIKPDGFEVKVTVNVARKVDGDLLQEIAKEHQLSEHLSDLFRWKPEVDLKKWKAADKAITAPLAAAITSTPGKPSIKISAVEQV